MEAIYKRLKVTKARKLKRILIDTSEGDMGEWLKLVGFNKVAIEQFCRKGIGYRSNLHLLPKFVLLLISRQIKHASSFEFYGGKAMQKCTGKVEKFKIEV